MIVENAHSETVDSEESR